MDFFEILSTNENYISNKYSFIYHKIVLKRIGEPAKSGEKHHVLPKSLFPEYTKSKWNIAKVTHREHFICHRLLIKMFAPGSLEYRKMCWALHRMSKKYTIGSKEYEIIRKVHLENLSYNRGRKCITNGSENRYLEKNSSLPDGWRYGVTRSKEHEEKLAAHRKNRKPLTEETKKKISKTNSGKKKGPIKEETRKKLSKKLKGRKITWNEKLKESAAKVKMEIELGIREKPKPFERTIDYRKKLGKEYKIKSPDGQIFLVTNLALFAQENNLCKNALVKSYNRKKAVPEAKNKLTEERLRTTGWLVELVVK